MSNPGALPTTDQLLGTPPQPGESGHLPTTDELLTPHPNVVHTLGAIAKGPLDLGAAAWADVARTPGEIKSTPALDAFFAQTPAGHILKAFGQNVQDAWGNERLGISDETAETLRKAGVFNDYRNGKALAARVLIEGTLRAGAVAADAAARTLRSEFEGAAGALQKTAEEVQGPTPTTISRIAAFPFGAAGEVLAGIPEGLLPEGHLPVTVARARVLNVIGEGDEVYFGTKEPVPATVEQQAEAIKQSLAPDAEVQKEAGMPEPPPQAAQATDLAPGPAHVPTPPEAAAARPEAPDIHAIARQIAPGTFQQYDALLARQQTYRQWIGELADQRAKLPEAVEAQARIDTILGRVNGAEDRLTKAGAARLEDARAELDRVIRSDSPDMAMVRRNLLTTQHQLWDLAPDVRAAMQQAQERMPPAVAPVEPPRVEPAAPASVSQETMEGAEPETPDAAPAAAIADAEAPAPVERPSAPPSPWSASAAAAGAPQAIVADVSKKLLSAGRPKEEADAAAALVASHYEARAARFNGAKGSAYELYAKEGPSIKAGGRQAAKEFAQPEKTLEQAAHPQTTTPEFKRWFGDSKIVDEEGAPLRMYRGDYRDIGPKFKKGISTSARFYFTNNPTVASNYAEGKAFFPEEANDFANWFKFPPPKGSRTKLNLDHLWWHLDEAQRGRLEDALMRARLNDETRDMEFSDEPDGGIASKQHWDYELKQARGNWLKAAKSVWLESGAIFNDEGQFMKILQRAGIKGEFDHPHEARPVVTPVFLSVKNPLSTRTIDQDFLDRIARELKGDRTKAIPGGGWDKAAVTPREWLRNLEADYNEKYASNAHPAGQPVDLTDSHAWTAIPEKVTEALKRMGYDGIDDRGGKLAGPGGALGGDTDRHRVVIAFEPEQIKSAIGNRGTFDESANILRQSRRGSITLKNARNTIRLFKDADPSTFIHETGHQWLEEMMKDAADERAPTDLLADAKTVRDWLGVKEGEAVPTKAHEKFARGFERYMMEGAAPNRALANVFAKFKAWLTQIYQTVSKLRAPINDEMRAVFDRLVATPDGKPIIAPEHPLAKTMADIHEADAETAPPEHAAIVADNAQGELDHNILSNKPELHNELNPQRQAGGREPPGAGAPGGGNAPGPVPGGNGKPAELGAVAEGNREVAPQGAGARAKQPEVTRVPREPLRLIDFIKRMGGIKDDRGDIATIISGDKKAARKLLNKGGRALDDMTRAAWDAGYFPEAGARRPDITELLEKIDADYRGNPQYSLHDYEAAQAYRDALQRNAEADRLADHLGLDSQAPDFWDKVAEHMSVEEMAAEIAAREGAAKAEFDEAEKAAKAYIEGRGEAWEPDAIYNERARTLEELEREYQAEIAARDVGQRAPGAQSAGPAPAGEGPVQERGGPGGGGVAPPGRESEEGAERRGAAGEGRRTPGGPTGQPAGPNERFTSPESELVDKAGNIRLDNLNTPEDVSQVIRETAEDTGGFMEARRGVLSDGQVLDLADALGMSPSFLNARKIGQAFNAEQIVAARKLLIQSATNLRDLMRTAAQGTDDDLMAYAHARMRHIMIQEQVSGITAEAGRALRAFRKMEGSDEAKLVGDILKDATGRTLNQLRQEAQLGATLQTPMQVSKYMDDLAKHPLKNAILEYYINALISGPITHFRYSVGNALNALWTPLVQIPAAAAIGAAREAAGLGADANRVHLGESGAQIFAMVKGSRDGWTAATEAFRTGISPSLPGERFHLQMPAAIPGVAGKIIRIPGKSVSAIHTFFKSLRYEQNIQGLAYRTAMNEGLAGEAFTNRVADLTTRPTPDMIDDAGYLVHPQEDSLLGGKDEAYFANVESATENALKELYMAPTKYDSAMGALNRAIDRSLVAKIIVPFMKIGSQITRNAFIEQTPIGILSPEIRAEFAKGGAAADFQAAKMTAGIALAGVTIGLAAEGLATGDGPQDPAQRARWLLTHRPNTIAVGPITIPYQGLGSLGMLMRFSANSYETAHMIGHETAGKLAFSFLHGVTDSVLDENFMRGVKDMLDAAYHPEEYGESYIKGFVTNWLPFSVGLGQVARWVDPLQRQQKTILETAEAKIPFLSEQLQPKRDMFGEPIPSDGPVQTYANDGTVREMDKLQVGIGKLQPKIRGIPLTEQQFDDYSRIAGRYTKILLDQDVATEGWSDFPAAMRIKMIHSAVTVARKTAADSVMLDDLATAPPGQSIMDRAIAAKVEPLQPAQQ